MEQAEVKYAPGMRIIVRGEEWMVKRMRLMKSFMPLWKQ